MYLSVIGPASGPQQWIGLTRSAEEQAGRLARLFPEGVVVHRDVELEKGFDQLAERVVSHSLRAFARPNKLFEVPPHKAGTAVDMAIRSISAGPGQLPPKPDYSLLVKHVRQNVLQTSQTALAILLGKEPSTVSRWEAGEYEPSVYDTICLRHCCVANGLPWSDEWVHTPPE